MFYVPDLFLEMSSMFDVLDNDVSVLIEPPKRINQNNYVCSKRFMLDDILEMYKTETIWALVMISGEGSSYYKVNISGDYINIKKINKLKKQNAKTHKKGGQSAQRYDRAIEGIKKANIKSTVDEIINTYLDIPNIILGGPTDMKNRVQKYIKKHFSSIKIINTPDTNISLNVKQECMDIVNYHINKYDNKIINMIQEKIELADDKLVFGYNEVCEYLKIYMLEYIIIDKSKDITEIKDLISYDCKIYVVSIPDYEYIGYKWY